MERDHDWHGLHLRSRTSSLSAWLLVVVAAAGALLTLWLALRAWGPEGPAPEGARTPTTGEWVDSGQDVTVPADGASEASDAAGDATEQTPGSASGMSAGDVTGEASETEDVSTGYVPEPVSGTSDGETPVSGSSSSIGDATAEAPGTEGVATGNAPEPVSGTSAGDAVGETPEPVSGTSTGNATCFPVTPFSSGSSLPGLSRHLSLRALPEEARSVLEGYRDGGGCVLVQSGYLDLFGRVWSCTVSGGTWVELQVLREVPDGEGTEVVSVRMDADSWADLDIGDLEAGMQEMGGM